MNRAAGQWDWWLDADTHETVVGWMSDEGDTGDVALFVVDNERDAYILVQILRSLGVRLR